MRSPPGTMSAVGGFPGPTSRAALVVALVACALAAAPISGASARPPESIRPAADITRGIGADAFVSRSDPRARFGHLDRLRVDDDPVFRTYVRFTISQVVGPVRAAHLRLFGVNDTSDGGSVYRVGNGWREKSVTWATRPELGRKLTDVGSIPQDDWTDVDLSSLVDGPGTYSIAIASWSGDGAAFVSREGESWRTPELILERGGDPIVAAAGDIACDPDDSQFNWGWGTPGHCQQRATSDLLVQGAFDAVLTTGDNQYDEGTLDAFWNSYDPSWGRVYSITHPSIGDHDDETPGSAGYFDYFGSLAGPRPRGYYSFDVGRWHIVALNSNCRDVGGCWTGSPEEKWLRADLAASSSACVLAYWHIPRFSSGPYGDNSSVTGLWWALYDYGVDVVLNGNTHSYERFGLQDPDGYADPEGVREFVVGTGGEELYNFSQVQDNSQVRRRAFGILKLTLHPYSYDWQFISIDDKVLDSGSTACH